MKCDFLPRTLARATMLNLLQIFLTEHWSDGAMFYATVLFSCPHAA